jgi:hypothetical protein
MTTNRESANRTNPNTLADLLRKLGLGDLLLGQMVQSLRAQDPDAAGTSGYNLATLDALPLPDHSKGAVVLRATARAGTVTGALTPAAYGATPTTGQIAVAPNGNIVTLAADAITDLDVVYVPERGDVIETYFPVVSNVLTLPASITDRHVVLLEEVEAVEGGTTGKKIILVPGGTPSAGQAALTDVAKTSVTFASADAVTRARVKLLVAATADLQSVLTAGADLI